MKAGLPATMALVSGLFGLCAGQANAQEVFIHTNSAWKFLSPTSNQGTGWVARTFNDASWTSGLGPFGYGDPWIRTTVPNNNPSVTYYFRQIFKVTNAASVTTLQARYMRDDGLVAYLNGKELFRSNLPVPPLVIDFDTITLDSAASPENGFYTNAISPNLLLEGTNVFAVEVHQNGTNSGDLTFYLELIANVPNPDPIPPSVDIDNPDPGDVVALTSIPVYASAMDIDGLITEVRFFDGATLLNTDTVFPYTFIWSNISVGTHTIIAVATDSQSLSVTSAPVTFTVVTPLLSLIPFGSIWKYKDDGSNQGTSWRQKVFNDSLWVSGPAELGYGDNDEATVVASGPVDNHYITTYFRKSFDLTNLAGVTNLALRVVRDDGVVVYLNGTPVFVDNMTNDLAQINYQTLALSSESDNLILATNLGPVILSGLLSTNNVIAAEIHQNSASSADISFDLQLLANPGPHAPFVNITRPTNSASFTAPASVNVDATAYDLDGSIANVTFYLDGVIFGTPDVTTEYGRTVTNVLAGSHTVTAIATDNSSLRATSQVSIIVLPAPFLTSFVATGSVWRFLDDGSNQGTAWRALGFNDSAWPSGSAEFGFGDLDEATIVSRVDSTTGMTNITWYFRRRFTVTNLTGLTNIAIHLRHDDGGVVYLNDVEVFRSNMPTGVIDYLTFAAGNTPSETDFNITNISPDALVIGANIVAVEIHNQSLASADMSFEFELLGMAPPVSPLLKISRSGPTTSLSWTPAEPGFRLESATNVTGQWTTATNQSNPQTLTVVPSDPRRFFRLTKP